METISRYGIRIFCITYNLFGFMMLAAVAKGWSGLVQEGSLVLGQRDVNQAILVILMILIFSSTYLIQSQHRAGIIIPIFILTFFICGGFVVLLPVLLCHIWFFSRPKMILAFQGPAKNQYY